MLGIDHRVGPIGGDDPAAPPRPADGGVVDEILLRALGGRQKLDPEPLEQRPGTVGRNGERLGDSVEIMVGGRRLQSEFEPEQVREDLVEPEPRGRASEQIIMAREQAPRLARLGS
jgi:hypothetical protein